MTCEKKTATEKTIPVRIPQYNHFTSDLLKRTLNFLVHLYI